MENNPGPRLLNGFKKKAHESEMIVNMNRSNRKCAIIVLVVLIVLVGVAAIIGISIGLSEGNDTSEGKINSSLVQLGLFSLG
jgi:hypothetical protein